MEACDGSECVLWTLVSVFVFFFSLFVFLHGANLCFVASRSLRRVQMRLVDLGECFFFFFFFSLCLCFYLVLIYVLSHLQLVNYILRDIREAGICQR